MSSQSSESTPNVPSLLVRGPHPAPAPHGARFLRPQCGQAPEALTGLSHTWSGPYLPVPSGTFRSFTLTPVRCLPTPGDRALWLSCLSRQHPRRSVCLVWVLLGSPCPALSAPEELALTSLCLVVLTPVQSSLAATATLFSTHA